MSANTPKRKLGGFFADIRLNFTLEQLSFVLMRLSGILLVVYIGLHIWTLSGIFRGVQAFDDHLAIYNVALGGAKGATAPTTAFAVVEWLLLVCVVFHMINGLRIIIADFWEVTRYQRKLLWYVGAATIVIGGVSLVWFIPGLGF
jgi:succinate dehydrogenase / fumarate reductase, cytochrome b subunit